MTTFTKITYAKDGDVAIITLNDPATLNACGPETAHELRAAFQQASTNARAILLTGAGRGFCSGANLSTPAMVDQSAAQRDPAQSDLGASLEKVYNPLVSQMRALPVPLVTAVNGAAAGIGCSLALLGDMIVCGQSGYFLQAFRRIGLVPDGGSTYMLARAIGKARAMEMMLMGEKISAEKALEWGLINRIVADDALQSEALALARTLAAGPTQTLALIRQAAWASYDNNWEQQIELERNLQRTAGRTQDFKIGVAAFLSKQTANFTGT